MQAGGGLFTLGTEYIFDLCHGLSETLPMWIELLHLSMSATIETAVIEIALPRHLFQLTIMLILVS